MNRIEILIGSTKTIDMKDLKEKRHYKDFKWKMPGDITKYIGERDKKRDTSLKGQKERLEGQLAIRKKYVELLESKENLLKEYISFPNEDNKMLLDIATAEIDAHNIKIEIVSQKNVYVDTYIYYKEDFMKRFESGEEQKKVNDYNKK
tara:strand:+ start:9206 stop:9649 length:444 start_codon:yes stop_codon:yes gene_type:complete